jgi:excisionase family DNA binding protein
VERKIDAPDKDWLTKDEAAAYLGITSEVFQALVDKGFIRGARKWTHRTKLWPWRALVIFSWEMEMGLIDEKNLAPE